MVLSMHAWERIPIVVGLEEAVARCCGGSRVLARNFWSLRQSADSMQSAVVSASPLPDCVADAPVLTSASFAAGCIAGAFGQLVGHPLDTVKVWAQTGSKEALRLPFRALFRGIAGPIVSAGGVQSVRLGMYETFRRCWGPSEASTPLPVVGLSSASAGLVVSFILCPLHRVKVAQQLYGGGLYATARQLRREGSLYRGLPAVVLFEANGLYMSAYVQMKRVLAGREGELRLWARVVAGASANVLTWAVLFPLDTIRSVQQSTPPGSHHQPPEGLVCSARRLVASGGWRRLYRGYGFTLLRAGPVAGVILPAFDGLLYAFEGRHREGGGAGPGVRGASARLADPPCTVTCRH